jgi:hypothetical protein
VIQDSVLDSLAVHSILSKGQGQRVAGSIDAPAVLYPYSSAGMADDAPIPITDPMLAQDRPKNNNKTGGALAGLTVAALAAGFWGYGARIRTFRNRCVVVRRVVRVRGMGYPPNEPRATTRRPTWPATSTPSPSTSATDGPRPAAAYLLSEARSSRAAHTITNPKRKRGNRRRSRRSRVGLVWAVRILGNL